MAVTVAVGVGVGWFLPRNGAFQTLNGTMVKVFGTKIARRQRISFRMIAGLFLAATQPRRLQHDAGGTPAVTAWT
ncbi:MAG: hypothetical protein DME84_07955, partial [Verrucomicrobia bacterium]